MGKRKHSCLTSAIAAVFTLTLGLTTAPVSALAEGGEPPIGGATGTKSWVSEACDSGSANLNPIDPKKSEHEKAIKACHDEVKASDTACQPGSNPNAQQAQNQANQYQQNTNQSASQPSGSGSGQSNNCGGFGDLMKNMQPPLQNYQGDCNGAKNKCQSTCSQKAEASQKACDSIPPGPKQKQQKEACKQNAQMVKQCNKKTSAACEKYSQQVAAIAAALMNGLLQMMQMQQCQQDQGLDCATNPTDPQCLKDDSVNCSKPEHYSNPQCICQVNPNAAGCPGADSSKVGEMSGRDPYSSDPSGDPSATTPADDALGLDGNRRKNAGAGPGAGGSGFGGGGGGSGGGRGADAGAAPAGTKPTSADVLAGDYGGGGGGGRGAMGGGYPEVTDSMGKALKNADLRKTAAAGGALTGANGRSNWQKVRERYRDNRPSLLEQSK